MATKKKAAVKKKATTSGVSTKKKPVVKKKAAKPAFTPHVTGRKAGEKAPAFHGIDQDGKVVSSEALKGKKIVLYFYPKDDTPGCTAQACSLRDGYAALKEKNIEVIGVSEDPVIRHKKFETKYQLPFRLIADEEHTVIDAYDVWGKKQFMGRVYEGIIRTTFLIDEKGKIKAIIEKPDTANHAAQILDYWSR
jgi:peroxiredoxin Q/BCP